MREHTVSAPPLDLPALVRLPDSLLATTYTPFQREQRLIEALHATIEALRTLRRAVAHPSDDMLHLFRRNLRAELGFMFGSFERVTDEELRDSIREAFAEIVGQVKDE